MEITLTYPTDSFVSRYLLIQARYRGVSVDKLAQQAIEQFLFGLPQRQTKDKEIIEALAGTWSEEEYKEFEENTAYFNQIDEELWK